MKVSDGFDLQLPARRSRIAYLPVFGIHHPRTMERRAGVRVDHRVGCVRDGCGRVQGQVVGSVPGVDPERVQRVRE